MSLYKGTQLVAGGRQCMPLLSFMWADHQLNDISWLRADTFSWQSGAVYTAVYQHLVDDIDGITAESETVGGITISFYRAPDGHKITTDESAVLSIYNATGVAWYYVLDTVNTRFKLPRTKWGFTGIRNGVGGFVEAGLPNITGSLMVNASTRSGGYSNSSTGAFYPTELGNPSMDGGSHSANGWSRQNFDASRSSPIYRNGSTVQPKATEMYLYFYVGQFTQTAIEQTAGLNTEMFNDLNAHKVIEYQEPTSANNYTWYRKYADGWVEQGGIYDLGGDVTVANQYAISLPVEMANTNYTGIAVPGGRTTGGQFGSYIVVNDTSNTTTAMFVYVFKTEQAYRYINWTVSGIAA